jgi:hypothetical protein
MRGRLMMIAVAMLAAAPGLAAKAAPAAAACNAACLTGLAGAFVDGLVTRKAGADVPWTARVLYTENGVGMTVGDGIWATVTRHTANPIIVADPASQSVVWIGAIEEHGQPSWLALRIKADGTLIAEAEAIMRRKEGRPPFADPTAIVPNPALARSAPGPRAGLIAAARAYLSGAAAAGVTHIRNGVVMAAADRVTANGDTLRAVRFPVVDAARGIVVATYLRDHSGRVAANADAAIPHSYALVSVFKIAGNKVQRVDEVSSDLLPYLMPAWKIR